MKILSIAVPCYNSQEYMRKCVDSLLKGGEDVEILIVDDGSKDDTLKIARDYEEKYPTIVKAIHQENKGHGGAVNTGLAHATGLYFKVVDSDDWLNEEALKKVNVLSGGEKVRCVLSKMMLSGANFLIFDEPTNHLDMESITALNEGMKKFKGNMLFTSHDHQLTQTVANRIIDIKENDVIDREVSYDEYLGIE